MTEKYLRIAPSGEITWINIDRVPYKWDPDYSGMSLDQIYASIGCSCMESVQTVIPGLIILVDESGKIKEPPQLHNLLASKLYAGFPYGDNIVGPVIVCAMRPTEPYGEMDLFPLNAVELAKLSLFLGVQLPDQEVSGND